MPQDDSMKASAVEAKMRTKLRENFQVGWDSRIINVLEIMVGTQIVCKRTIYTWDAMRKLYKRTVFHIIWKVNWSVSELNLQKEKNSG